MLTLIVHHPALTALAALAIFFMASIAGASLLTMLIPVRKGVGQIISITPWYDGWATVGVWFENDLFSIRTRDHERGSYSVGEPVLIFHKTFLGWVDVDRIKSLA